MKCSGQVSHIQLGGRAGWDKSPEVMTLSTDNYTELRQYLLGDLDDEARQRVERRLLTEPGFLEELLLGEEELIDDYVGGGLPGGERLKFERHFLCTPERRRQLNFARSLSRYVSESEGEAVVAQGAAAPAPRPAFSPRPRPAPSLFERFRAFWGGRTLVPRAALSFAAVAVVAVSLLAVPSVRRWFFPPRTFATLALAAGAGVRGQGGPQATVPVPLKEDALRIFLTLPEGAPASGYRVELQDSRGKVESLKATRRDARSVSVEIPSDRLARGQYALILYATAADGTEQRVQDGSYLFNAE